VSIDRSSVPTILEIPFQATPGGAGTVSGDHPDRFTFTGLATKLVGQEVAATSDVLVWSVDAYDGQTSQYVTASGSTNLFGVETARFTLTTRPTASIVNPVTLKVRAASGSVFDEVTFTVMTGSALGPIWWY
jgi:hypothetical protein